MHIIAFGEVMLAGFVTDFFSHNSQYTKKQTACRILPTDTDNKMQLFIGVNTPQKHQIH
jgi:hypothetical protein